MTDNTKCERATDVTVKGYVYCGKPSTHVVTEQTAHGPNKFGLCDEHLAEMREQHLLGGCSVKPAEGREW